MEVGDSGSNTGNWSRKHTIFVDGRTARLPLEWKEAVSTVSFFW